MSNDNQQQQPVTRAELQTELDRVKREITDELTETIRQVETSLLKAFHG